MNTDPKILPLPELQTPPKIKKDRIVLIGYAALFVSFLTFGVTEYVDPAGKDHFSILVAITSGQT